MAGGRDQLGKALHRRSLFFIAFMNFMLFMVNNDQFSGTRIIS